MVLYHIQFTSADEHFEKIGITRHDPFKRFAVGKYLNYDMKVLTILDLEERACRDLEKTLHNKYEEFKYTPITENFSGKTECFYPDIIDISQYTNLYNKYKNSNIEEKEINKKYINNLHKINVDNLYMKDELLDEDVESQKFFSTITGLEYLALVKQGKLYAKEIPELNSFYKVSENNY